MHPLRQGQQLAMSTLNVAGREIALDKDGYLSTCRIGHTP